MSANKKEIQFLKYHQVLGRRAPSCMLLDGRDLVLLLESYHKQQDAKDLTKALDNEAWEPIEITAEMLKESNRRRSTPYVYDPLLFVFLFILY
jgi:hypothetical protein